MVFTEVAQSGGALLRGEPLIRFAHVAYPLAMLTQPPTGGININRNLLFDVSPLPPWGGPDVGLYLNLSSFSSET